tara:strand:- start:116 stop:343 length:228 start_codon:yes stop_codon:yes gene_type:complete
LASADIWADFVVSTAELGREEVVAACAGNTTLGARKGNPNPTAMKVEAINLCDLLAEFITKNEPPLCLLPIIAAL